MKFSEMQYTRPDIEKIKEKTQGYIQAMKQAQTGAEAVAVFMESDEYFEHAASMASLAAIRHSMDTTEEFYAGENDYLDENLPLLRELGQVFEKTVLDSPHRAALEEAGGSLMFKNIEINLKTFIPEIVSDLQQENKLTTEYDKLMASAQIPFEGETLTLSQLAPYHQSPDRAVRRRSMEARVEWMNGQAEAFDQLFDQLVRLRHGMAQKMGYDNFIPLGYFRMMRNCYDQDMISQFREGVRRHLVPLAARLKGEQARRVGVDVLTVYDDPLLFPDGNPKPQGTPEEIFAAGREMYRELSADTGEFIDFMLENELFDVLSRKGKSPGGFCDYIPDHKAPFIFANFNGTAADIDVLTHEAGHAYAGYRARDLKPSSLREYTYETAEVHSMSMEFLTWPWMDRFFGDQADKRRYGHLSDAVTFIPYGTMVDHFQHEAYANPGMTPGERNQLWRELEAQYRPWLDLDFPFYREGRRWQAQAHIFERPFYYIDYCLAQTVALAIWGESLRAFPGAWAKYQAFTGFAGQKTFTECVAGAGLPSPFAPDSLKTVADAAAAWLDR